jgi:hypothetical protein
MTIKNLFVILTTSLAVLFSACDSANENNNNNNQLDNDGNLNVNNNNTGWQTDRDNYRSSEKVKIDSLRDVIHKEDSTYEKTHQKNEDWENTKVKINRELDSLQADVDQLGYKAENEWQKSKNKIN